MRALPNLDVIRRLGPSLGRALFHPYFAVSCKCLRLPGLLAVLAALSGCMPQGEILDPADGGNLPSLGVFRGQASTENIDTAFSTRYLGMDKPKVALVWQFIGPKQFTYDATDGVVKEALIPFKFILDVRNPPGKEIMDSPDLALASFWLYQDGNNNGKMDCLLHPSLLEMNLSVDDLYAIYLEALDKVLEVSQVMNPRVAVVDTYFIGTYGTTVHKNGDRLDTIWTGTEKGIPGVQVPHVAILDTRYRILNNANRWERFFALRKRANDYFRLTTPVAGFAMAIEYPYERKLFPLPGKEAEFEARVSEATWKLAGFNTGYTAMITNAFEGKWTDYPYDNRKAECPDWVAGRSRQHFLLYFRNQATLNEMLEAERGSSFSVTGKERLRPGYNLIRCDANYDCHVLKTDDSVQIDLGTSEDYFNPPNVPLVKPVETPKEIAVPEARLKRLSGAYRFQPFHPFCMTVENGNLWVSIPDQGGFRLMASDSLHFFAPAADLQIQVVGEAANPEKLLLYRDDKRYVAVFDSTLEIPEAIRERLRSFAARSRVSIGRPALKGMEGGFVFGSKTLTVEAPSGDSLRVSIPGFKPHFFQPASDTVYFSPYSDRQITFRRNESGDVTGIELLLGDSVVAAPSVLLQPRTAQQLFPEAEIANPDSVVSASDGSHKDVYVGLDAKGHYPGSADLRFVGSGDGWVAHLDPGLPGDSVSLPNGEGGMLFKATGIKGLSAALELRLRRDMRGGAGRVRFRVRGGEDPSRLDRALCDDFWTKFEGDSALVLAGAWPIPSDPYYFRIERIRTADAAPAVAVDSYRVLVSRETNADP